MDFMPLLLTGATAAALVKLLDNVIQWKLGRKAKKEDDTSERERAEANQKQADFEKWRKDTDTKIAAIVEGQKCILLDRLQHLGRASIKGGEIDYDYRRHLHQMHECLFTASAERDLDELMSDVNDLPLQEN
jgi:hypothetical protein